MSTLLRRTLCHTSTTVRAVAVETATLAGHLLRYPAGLAPEPRPLPPAGCGNGACGHGVCGHGICGHPACGHPACGHQGCGHQGCGHPAAGGPPTPVLLLHGLFDNRSVFLPLRRYLRSHGFERVHAVNYGLLTSDVHDAAVRFGRQLEEVRRAYGVERVAVVGHSLGGLIARYYVQRLDGAGQVHSVVTLGTPHQGSYSALLLRPLPIARQLLPGSAVLEALREPAPDCDTRFVAFWGDRDPLVLPWRNAQLHHTDLLVENILVPGAGHLALTVHPEVLATIRRLLTEAAPAGQAEPPDRMTA